MDRRTLTGLRILYIDDDPGLGRLVARNLARHGLTAEVATDGVEGLARVARGGVDAVALDHYMPGQDGLATLQALRDLPGCPPVVYVTASDDLRIAVAALKGGAMDFVLKDVQGEFMVLLREALMRALAATRLQREVERSQQELAGLEERFRQVVESAPNAMVMINAAGQIEMVNAQAERVFGYARRELLGNSVELLIPKRFRVPHPKLRESFFAAPQSRPMGAGRELYARRKDGSEFPVEIGLNPIETDEGTMVLSAIVDISDRKQKEERLLAALQEKDLLLREIHHRVKNNLQVVNSLLDLGSARINDAAASAMLQESQNRIKSMAIIHQMLYESRDFARVDFGSFLETLVPSLVSSYRTDPGRIALSINAADVRLPIGAAIPCGLVVNELVSNALKHAFPGQRQGEITLRLASEETDNLVLCVSDDGIGLPADLDLTQTPTLGMQLVTLLADQLGAELTVHRSNPTRFTLQFPIQR